MKYLVINNESTTKEQYWSYCEKSITHSLL